MANHLAYKTFSEVSMVQYSGITTDSEGRCKEHLSDETKPNIRNWKVVKLFASRKEAQDWENDQNGEHHPGGAPAQGPWYGYQFDYGEWDLLEKLKVGPSKTLKNNALNK